MKNHFSFDMPSLIMFASKDALARSVKEVMKKSRINTAFFKSYSTRAASVTMVYKSCVLLGEVAV